MSAILNLNFDHELKLTSKFQIKLKSTRKIKLVKIFKFFKHLNL